MAIFSDLSPDLIMELWERILHPDDIDSFALVSRRTHATGRIFLDENRRLKAQYSSVQTYYSRSCCNKPWGDLLRDILLDSRRGAYVQHLDIQSSHSHWQQGYGSYRHPGNCHHDRYSETDMLLFKNAIRSSTLRSRIDKWRLKQTLARGDEDPIIAILLTMLPELRSLKIDNVALKGTFQTFQHIADSGSTGLLSKLEEVEISSVKHEIKGVSVFQPFAVFPSMKRLSCNNFQLDWSVGAAETRMPLQTSNISELTISGSGLDSKNLFGILGAFKALKRFTFVRPANCRGFDPFWIRAALLAYARHSLEYLVFKSPDDVEGERCVGSLQDFEKLRILKIDHSSLVDPQRCETGRTAACQHRVADYLPRTLEELVLCIDRSELHDQVYDSMRSLLKAKTNGHLSFLNKLEFRLWFLGPRYDDVEPLLSEKLDDGLVNSWKTTCEQKGIILTVSRCDALNTCDAK
ncbi:hypothetical protein N7G274_001861 [Stereocaulon virgatum]|uniref:Leucine-rich repeat domain-containing protein n=1 Tax=Stereocaulon virgatum TaxID=373712 RepID=A0ABR4AP07_9LECA